MLTLAEAVKQNRLAEFASQEESRGVGAIDRSIFEELATALIKAPRSEGRTSRSSSADGSTGKRTRRGSGQGA